MNETPTEHQPSRGQYEIRFQGHLHSRWASWFDGLTVTDESDGTTLVLGPVADQQEHARGVPKPLGDYS